MRWPLRFQILVPMIGLMLATLAGTSALNAYFSTQSVRRQIEQLLQDVAKTLAESSFPLSDSVLRQTRGLSGAQFAVVDASEKSSQGKIIARSSSELTSVPQDVPARRWDELTLGETTAIADRRYFHAVVKLGPNQSSDQPRQLHIFYPEQAWREAWRSVVYPALWVGGGALLLMTVLAVGIAAHVSRPIQRLRNQLERISTGDFSAEAPPARDDEIRDLSLSINAMARMLARYEDDVRRAERLRTLGQLGGGIAHQMRNAATGCRMALDLHRRECPAARAAGQGGGNGASGNELEESLAVAARQLALMEKYLQRFLTLGNSNPQPMARVSLATLLEEVVPLVRPAASHVGVAVEVIVAQEPVILDADADALGQMLVNLLLNAIEAASAVPNTSAPHVSIANSSPAVTVRLTKTADNLAIIEVCDTGPGPDEKVREQLFEPLVTGKPDGTGLGLSVARQIARRHRGDISWRRDKGLTIFTVSLPTIAGESLYGHVADRG